MKSCKITFILFFSFCLSSKAQFWRNFNDTNSAIIENYRNNVVEGNNGVIWIQSDHTLLSYNDGIWDIYNFSSMGMQFQNVLPIPLVVHTSNHLWFLADSFLVEFDGANFITHDTIGLGEYQIEDMAINRKDNAIWFATGLGLVKYLGGTFTRFTTANSGLTFDEVRSVTVDTNGWIWARVYDPSYFQPVIRFDNTIWWLPYQGIYYNSVWNGPRCIKADNFGNVWWGFENNIGIRKYLNGALDSFPNFGGASILPIGIDRAGNPWFHNLVLPLLIAYYDGSAWIYIDGHDFGMPNNCNGISSFAYDNYGNTWMGTEFGVVVFNPDGLSLQSPQSNFGIQLHLYPSLTEKEIFIEGKFAGQKSEIKIFDTTGKLMLDKSETPTANKFQLDVEWLPEGLYYIQIITIENQVFYSSKFIKQ
jgi:hypothetical protein